MTEAVTKHSPSLEALELAEQALIASTNAVARATEDLRCAARVYLMDSPEDELIQRAATVYWRMPMVSVGMISSVVLGNDKAVHKLNALLPKDLAPVFSCEHCGADITARSRSHAAELFRPNPHFGIKCDACEKAQRSECSINFEERERAWIERVSALRTMPYREYLVTEEWLERRNRKLKQAGYRCQLCNSGGLLNVHHRTYERRGCENDADLIALCQPCHAKFHGKLPQ